MCHTIEETHHRFNIRMRHGVKFGKVELEVRTNVDISALVLGAVAILGCGEDGDASAVVLDLVALHAYLVRADDGFETVVFAESLGDVGAKLETHTTLRRTSTRVGLWVRPKHLHHETTLTRLALVVSGHGLV